MNSYEQLKRMQAGATGYVPTGKTKKANYDLLKRSVGNIEDIKNKLAERDTLMAERQKKIDRYNKAVEYADKYKREASSFKNRALLAIDKFARHPIKNTAEFVLGGAMKASDYIFGRKIEDKGLQEAIKKNNKTILYINKKIKDVKNENTKRLLLEQRRNLFDENLKISREVGGDLKDKTNRQLAFLALEAGIDLGTLGGGSILKSLGENVLKKTGEIATEKLSKKIGTKTTMGLLGGAFGVSNTGQEKDVKAKDYATGLAIGAVGGAGLAFGGELLFKGGTKLFKKIFKNADTIAEKEFPKGVDIERPAQGRTVDDFIVNRSDLTVKKAPAGMLDIENKPIISRLEWDFKNKKGTLYITPNATKADIAHEVGHYLARKEPSAVEKFSKEALKIIDKDNKNISENFADAVKKIITEKKAREEAPNLADFIKDQGIKFEKEKSIKATGKIEKKSFTRDNIGNNKISDKNLVDVIFDKEKELANKNPNLSQRKSQIVGISQKKAQIKRLLERKPTIREAEKTAKKLSSIYRGKKIKTVDGYGIATGRASFGKHEIKLDNGNIKFFEKNKITENKQYKPNSKEVLDFLENKAKKIVEEKAKEYGINTQEKDVLKKKVGKKIAKTIKNAPTAVQEEAKKVFEKTKNKKKAVKKIIEYEETVNKKNIPQVRAMADYRRGNYGVPVPKKKVKSEGINITKLNTSKEIKEFISNLYHENDEFKSVRPSRTDKDIIEGAMIAGIDVNNKKELDNVLKSFPNASVAHKLKQSLVDSTKDLIEYLKWSRGQEITNKIRNELKEKFLRTEYIAKTYAGLRTEASHLLRSFKLEVQEGENFAIDELMSDFNEIIDKIGDKKLAKVEGIIKFSKRKNELLKPTVFDKYLAVWYNSILSGWNTWTRNIVDTLSLMSTEMITQNITDLVAREGTVSISEYLKSMPSATKKALKVLLGKEDVVGKFNYDKKIAPYFKNKKVNLWLTEASGRALDAQDTAMASPIEQALKHSQKWYKKMKKIGITDNTAEALNKAISQQFSERLSYRNKPLGVSGKISGAIGSLTTRVKGIKLIIPFTRVVANVVDRKIDYLPIVNLSRTFGKKYLTEETEIILKKAGIEKKYWDKITPIVLQRLKHQQMGRFVMGNAVMVGATALALNGKISGSGPTNKNEKKQLLATGWRPNAIKIGDKWVPYSYFGALSGVLSVAGEIHDALKYGNKNKDFGEHIANGLLGFTRNIMSQSFLSGVADLITAIQGNITPKDYFSRLLTGFVPIPNAIPQTVNIFDRKMRDQKDDKMLKQIGNLIEYKLGVRNSLRPQLNAFGEEMRRDLVYGITPSKEKNDIQKKLVDRGLKVNVPDMRTKINGVKLNRQQLWEYTVLRGELLKKYVPKLIDKYDRMSVNRRDDWFKNKIRKIDRIAKKKFAKKYKIKKQ